MAFLQVHDPALRSSSNLRPIQIPLPHDLITQEAGNNDRSPLSLQSLQSYRSCCCSVQMLFTGPFVHSTKGNLHISALGSLESPRDILSSFGSIWLISETFIRSLLGAGSWECQHRHRACPRRAGRLESLCQVCSVICVEVAAGCQWTLELGAWFSLDPSNCACSEVLYTVCWCLPFLLYSSIPFEH